MATRKQTARALTAVVAAGDLRESLEALRDKLAATIEVAESREVAQLSRQLAAVLTQLDGLRVPEKSKVDELAKQREARRNAAAISDEAFGGQ